MAAFHAFAFFFSRKKAIATSSDSTWTSYVTFESIKNLTLKKNTNPKHYLECIIFLKSHVFKSSHKFWLPPPPFFVSRFPFFGKPSLRKHVATQLAALPVGHGSFDERHPGHRWWGWEWNLWDPRRACQVSYLAPTLFFSHRFFSHRFCCCFCLSFKKVMLNMAWATVVFHGSMCWVSFLFGGLRPSLFAVSCEITPTSYQPCCEHLLGSLGKLVIHCSFAHQ